MLAQFSRVHLTLLLFGSNVAVHNALAQFVEPPTTLKEVMGYAGVSVRYKEVPAGICEQDPEVKSFSGYADVSEDEHIFWWFFEARNEDPEEAPLTVWINGGPGSSSMIGLFEELGPCGVDYFGNVYNNPYSWTNASNMLFIDQPSQVGFSYSKPVKAWSTGEDIIALPDDVTACPDYAPPGSCGTYAYPNLTLTANSTAAAAPTRCMATPATTPITSTISETMFSKRPVRVSTMSGPPSPTRWRRVSPSNICGPSVALRSI